MRCFVSIALVACILLAVPASAQRAASQSLSYSPFTPEARLTLAQDTTGAPTIELRSGFFKADRFVYGEREPERVFTFWGTLSPDLKDAMGRHPEARQQAEQAGTFATVGVIGSAVLLALSFNALLNTSTDADSIAELEEASSSTQRALSYALGGVLVSAVSGALARSRVREGVRLFNERQAAVTSPTGTEPVVQSEEVAPVSEASSPVVEAQRAPAEARPKGLESWYTYWGLGWSSPGYSAPVEQALFIDRLRDTPGVDDVAISLDLLGFYFPVGGDKTIVGGVINGAAERFQNEGGSLQVNQYLLAASAMHFFNEHVGRGFFARGDLGLARVVIVADDSFGDAMGGSGFGFLLGGGYAFPVTPGTRLLLNANVARRSVEGESYSAFSLALGGLF